MQSSKKQTIIWAVNPTKNPKDAKELIKEMKVWSKKLNFDVQPVAVFSKLKTGFPAQLNLLWGNNFEEFAKSTFDNYLKKLPTKSFLKPQILYSNSLSNRSMAADLSSFAKKVNAAMIFACTRVKETKNPIRLGGFAESLITLSSVPVMLMNPSVESKANKKTILFPTNFTPESQQSLVEIKPWVTELNSKVILFNQIQFPEYYTYDTVTSKIHNILKETEALRRESLENISHDLSKDQIKSSVIVARSHNYLGAQIIEVARKNKVELIVITNTTGPLYQSILGSVAKDVLVRAKCPVLVLNHHHEEKTKMLEKKDFESEMDFRLEELSN